MKTSRIVALLLLALSFGTHATTPPKVISETAQSSVTGYGDSFAPTFSPDGRFVVFVSQAKNLTTNGASSPWLDVFLHDLETGRTELVSVNTNGVGGGNGNSFHPSVSSNGLFVAFGSGASNLVANDTNGYGDVFVRDMVSGVTVLVSVSTNGAGANGGSGAPLISADGVQIVFESGAWNVFPNDTNRYGIDIVLHDRLARTNLLISIDASGTGSALGYLFVTSSDQAAMSDDARYIVFESSATNLVHDSPPYGGIFVRDVEAGMTYGASTGRAYIQPIISADSRHVFCATRDAANNYQLVDYNVLTGTTSLLASNLLLDSFLSASADGRFVTAATTNAISVFDTLNGTAEIVCGDGVMPDLKSWRSPVISANGQRVAFVGATNIDGPPSVYVYDRQIVTRQLVSVTANGEPAEIAIMSEPVISRDGRRIAFESRAANLVAGDLNQASDIFVRDLSNNTTHVVSAAAVPSATAPLASSVGARSAGELGRVIAFTSFDHTLATNDDNAWRSAFVRDRVSGTNRVLATAASRALGTNRLAFNPTLSLNGRYVAWQEHPVPLIGSATGATNIFWLDLLTGAERVVSCGSTTFRNAPPTLSPDGRWLLFTAMVPGYSYKQVFRCDMFSDSATNELLSQKYGGTGPATGDSSAPAMSADGKRAVFASWAVDVVTNISMVTNPQGVARNLTSGKTHWVSFNANGFFISNWGISDFAISRNSRYVFVRSALESSPQVVYRHDLKTQGRTNLLACTGCSSFSVTEDGNVIAYRADSDTNIYVRDVRSGETTLVSTNALGCCLVGGSSPSFAPQISGDGRYIVFASAATNLVLGDTNNAIDVFVHDRTTRTTMLVSRNAAGAVGAGSSSTPVLAPDGRTVVFSSSASDLVAGDFNNARDVFVLRLGGEDSDLDGMDDDWEMAYFNTLARDGSGDFDVDGATDRHEFEAGTDPTNIGSIFRALTIEPGNGNSRLVLWQSQMDRKYRVEFKNDLSEEFWEELGTVTASGSIASLADPAAAPRRIYRVVLLP